MKINEILIYSAIIFIVSLLGTHISLWIHNYVKYDVTKLSWDKEVIKGVINLVAIFITINLIIWYVRG